MKVVAHCNEAELKAALCCYQSVALNFDTADTLPRHVTSRSIPLHKQCDLSEIADAIGFFDYRIFPLHIMQFYGQWQADRREIRIGDIIVQCARLPLGCFKGIFAVKVLDFGRNTDSCVLSYGTLLGHAEQGISTFSLKRIDKSVLFEIETFSQPAWPLTRIMAPVSRLYQQYCTNLAVANVIGAVKATTEKDL